MTADVDALTSLQRAALQALRANAAAANPNGLTSSALAAITRREGALDGPTSLIRPALDGLLEQGLILRYRCWREDGKRGARQYRLTAAGRDAAKQAADAIVDRFNLDGKN